MQNVQFKAFGGELSPCAKHWVRYISICGSLGIKLNILIKAVIAFVPPSVNFPDTLGRGFING